MKRIALLSVLLLVLAGCAPAKPVISTTQIGTTPIHSASGSSANEVLPTSTVSPTQTVPGSEKQPTSLTNPGSTTGVNVTGGIPNFDHIVLMVLENRDYSNAMNGNSMPNLTALAQKNILLSNYFAASHPSLPNYIALVSGSTQNITSDCKDCFIKQPNLADEIEASGRTWKSYLESMPSPCFLGDANPYAQKHNPFLYFNSIRLNATRCDNSIVSLTQLDSDLAANQLPNFSFIMPNLCNSGHDCDAATADKWMGVMVAKLQASTALGQNSLIIITFDEASTKDTSSCCGLGKGGGKVATILISPLARPGFTDDTAYSHYSMLKTILKAWNLPDLGKTDRATIQPIELPWSVTSSSLMPTNTPQSSTSGANQAVNQPTGCASSGPDTGVYTAKICFTKLSNGSKLAGDVKVSAKIETTGAPASVRRTIFYLDGEYLLTSYYSPYEFTLPTEKWMDGSHTLSVEAMMRDSFVTQRASLTVSFTNGTISPPVNTHTFQPSTGTPSLNGQPFIVAATGDGASGGEDASKVTDLITSLNPSLFLYLGDVYEQGSLAEFYNWYGTSSTFFGQLRAITNPTIGNHDYLSSGDGSAYFDYWDNIPNYYSYNANGWHFVSLNSNANKVPISPESDQYKWLQQDLAKNSLPCTIVYYHHPLFNIGPEGTTDSLADVWKLMAQYKVSIVLNGHDHDYQRWVPLDGDGQPSQGGITEFVLGAGGHGLQSFAQEDSRVAYSNNSDPAAFGALFLQLNSSGANFSYVSTDESILDAGVIPCGDAGEDVQDPSIPTGLAATVMTSSRVDLTWSASEDNTGVDGYEIYRNGSNIATVPAYSLEYSDTNVSPAITYTYSIIAFDSVGHHSLSSANIKVVIPGVASSVAFLPVADLYVNSDNPDSNYGKTPFLKINSSPEMNGYLRFTVSGLGGRTISGARLLIYANNSNKQGISVISVENNKWDEMSMDYTTAPSLGSTQAFSSPFTTGSWISIDLSDYITGEGTYDLAITTFSDKTISLASREAGTNAPQLIVDFH